MSDYINIKDDRFWEIPFDEACVEGKQAERIQKELEKITVDEKGIIRKAFERVVERLRGEIIQPQYDSVYGYAEGNVRNLTNKKAIKIVNEEGGLNE